MSSFYGGQRGISLSAKKVYNSFKELKDDFASSDCVVNVDEYGIINSGINDEYNGNLYRRNMRKEPELICCLAGPMGPGTPIGIEYTVNLGPIPIKQCPSFQEMIKYVCRKLGEDEKAVELGREKGYVLKCHILAFLQGGPSMKDTELGFYTFAYNQISDNGYWFYCGNEADYQILNASTSKEEVAMRVKPGGYWIKVSEV